MVKSLWKIIVNDVALFMNNNSVEKIVFSKDNPTTDEKILKCLLYIKKGEMQEAVGLANNELAKGNKGKFSNEGSFFYERIVRKYGS